MEREEDIFNMELDEVEQDNACAAAVVDTVEEDEEECPRKVSLDDFHVISTLGKGGFGKVSLVRKISGLHQGTLFAMKTIQKKALLKGTKDVPHARMERNVLEQHHPFLVDLMFAFRTDSKLYMVMEFVRGGDFYKYLDESGLLREEEAQFYLAELIVALCYLHSQGIIFRDLKPENILICEDGHIKLADFGMAKQFMDDNQRANSLCGTPDYMAPEMILKKGHGAEVDWWALGVIAFETMLGEVPFKGNTPDETKSHVLSWTIKPSRYLTRAANDLITKLLKKDPESRLGRQPLGGEAVKKHRFFRDIEWQVVAERGLRPPFIPKLESETDVKYFDAEFTGLKAGDSVVSPPIKFPDEDFQGFSYDFTFDRRRDGAGPSGV